jgi:DNA-binding phage protein
VGILWKIRKERDPPSFKLAHDVIEKFRDEFLYWGPVFTDFSPITPQKAMANVTWLARMFLNYEEPLTKFTQILNSKGEAVLLKLVDHKGNVSRAAQALRIERSNLYRKMRQLGIPYSGRENGEGE